MQIDLKYKKDYGEHRFYPRSLTEYDNALVILTLMHRKTFTLDQVKLMVSSGWTVTVDYEKIDLERLGG